MLALNELASRLLVAGIPLASALATRAMAKRIERFPAEQAALRERYGVTPDTPLRGYDDETRAAVLAFARAQADARIATTSGSTGAPKQIAYTRARLKQYQRDSYSVGMRAYARHRVRRPGIFIFASLKADDSFASLVLENRRVWPPWLLGLIEPSRYLSHPALLRYADEHGANAARLWLMTVADPGLLYATNPSTLAVFFSDVTARWRESTALVRRFVGGELDDDEDLQRIARRVGTAGFRARLDEVARADAPLPVWSYLPGLCAWCSWDGGYVTSFLAQVRRHLPGERYAHVPMYSMSTETIETLTWFDDDGEARFLPLGPGVLYELLPEGAADDPAQLVPATSAEPGRVYSMVVSDPWGLRRYQTDDLFRCEALVRGLPDLRFLRRRGLAYSFTGEKLTGEQLSLAFDELRRAFPALQEGVELACFPSHPEEGALPGYRLALAVTRAGELDLDLDAVAAALDQALMRLNTELKDKRDSGRLRPTVAVVVPYEALAAALDTRTVSDDDVNKRAWESQFKLTPLVKTPWEQVAARL